MHIMISRQIPYIETDKKMDYVEFPLKLSNIAHGTDKFGSQLTCLVMFFAHST